MKTTKGGKVMNPTDAYRKQIRKKELKRNKKERKKVREVGILKKDPDTLKEQIGKLEMMKADGALDKARKHKKRQLEDTLHLVMKKRKEYEEKMREKGEAPVMFSHLGPPRRLTNAEEDDRVKHPKPEDSVYYHATLNPTGAPPPGKPPMYKSSIGPRIPLSADSSSNAASSSNTELEEGAIDVPPPPSPPPLPDSEDGPIIPASSLPLPPPPPLPPKPTMVNSNRALPHPPLPPPAPPGPPPKELAGARPPLPPPLTPKLSQPPPPGTSGTERDQNQSTTTHKPTNKEPAQFPTVLPPPPPPAGMLLKSATNHSSGVISEADSNVPLDHKDFPKMITPPPPPRQQPPMSGITSIPTLQPDVLPPGISRFPLPPPPPPPGIFPQLSAPGLPNHASPAGGMIPLIPRPPYGLPPGPPPMLRPPLPPGPPPTFHEDNHTSYRPTVPQKPSYVKSAASTVVKKPLAQHTPELTAMVPASVRVRREVAVPKSKPKPLQSASSTLIQHAAITVMKPESSTPLSGPKSKSIDDSYMAFLEDMKALGALEG